MILPVSIKGIVFKDNKVILLKNERNEWELPGGRLEPHEMPEECVIREIKEELSLDVRPKKIIDAWVYAVTASKSVFIVTYLCELTGKSELQISQEHKEFGLFAQDEIPTLNMPQDYKRSILPVM